MRNIVRDIAENCPECHCSTEKTIEYLYKHGDIAATADYYREIWYFYLEVLKMQGPEVGQKKKAARELTMQHFEISFETFKRIRKKLIASS